MAEEFPFTGEDIDRVTGGRVNSGVLRMWISEGRLKAGARAKNIRGGPRTFNWPTVLKAALMGELRNHGLSLPASDEGAVLVSRVFELAETGKVELEVAAKMPVYFVIKPDSGAFFQIPVTEMDQSLHDLMTQYGPIVAIIDVISFSTSLVAELVIGLTPRDRIA